MQNAYSRMELLLGRKAVDKIAKKKIAVFGLGGVGSYVVETLVRCGVGCLTLVDCGKISPTNMNRELFALKSTVGMSKVQAAKNRIQDIDENILVHVYETFYNTDTAELFDLRSFDYIVDATDHIPTKLLLIQKAELAGTPIISCMNTGNIIDPAKLMIGDISKAHNSSNIKMIRKELKKQGIQKVKILFSKEREEHTKNNDISNSVMGSIAFVPGIAGLMIASEVIKDLLKNTDKKRIKFNRRYTRSNMDE